METTRDMIRGSKWVLFTGILNILNGERLLSRSTEIFPTWSDALFATLSLVLGISLLISYFYSKIIFDADGVVCRSFLRKTVEVPYHKIKSYTRKATAFKVHTDEETYHLIINMNRANADKLERALSDQVKRNW